MARGKGEGPEITMENDTELLIRAGGAVDPSEGVRPPAPPRRDLRPGDMTAVPNEPIQRQEPVPVPTRPDTPQSFIEDAHAEQELAAELSAGPGEEILPPLAPSPVAPQPVASHPAQAGIRPGNYDQLPAAQEYHEINRRRNGGRIVVEVGHEMQHRERRVLQVYHVVTSDPKKRMPVGTGFSNGIPLTVFGVPTETGRRYTITVEETADSAPQPKRVPWGGNQTV